MITSPGFTSPRSISTTCAIPALTSKNFPTPLRCAKSRHSAW
jgi:hypothetical protein